MFNFGGITHVIENPKGHAEGLAWLEDQLRQASYLVVAVPAEGMKGGHMAGAG